jgi:large subunit ribosomal protein L11
MTMAKVTVKALIDGGKAVPGPPLGPALAAHKVNIGQVIAAINEKTKEFSGMQVPIEVEIEPADKSFKIKVGTPPTSALIKKEIKAEKLAKTAWKEPAVGDISMDAVAKITKAKFDVLGSHEFKKAAKQVVSTCVSIGVSVEGRSPKEILKEIDEGKWDSQLK